MTIKALVNSLNDEGLSTINGALTKIKKEFLSLHKIAITCRKDLCVIEATGGMRGVPRTLTTVKFEIRQASNELFASERQGYIYGECRDAWGIVNSIIDAIAD